jgi:hypothetical protein
MSYFEEINGHVFEVNDHRFEAEVGGFFAKLLC